MIKKITLLLAMIIFIMGQNFAYADSRIQKVKKLSDKVSHKIHAKSWVVMDQKTGEVLLHKNMNTRQYPASITKLATAFFAIEREDITKSVTVSEIAAQTPGSSLYLDEGDTLPLKDLIYGIMLHSGNDGAVAIAEHIAESEKAFAEKLTRFIKSIGAENTNFTNASGLHNKNHYTSAYDMALIAKHAMDNQFFRKVVSSKTYRWDEKYWTDRLHIQEKDDAKQVNYQWSNKYELVNHNRLLFKYNGASGIKNGFTRQSRYTLVGSAKRGNNELIAVVLRSPDRFAAYQDVTKLLDVGFQAHESIIKEKNEVEIKKPILDKQLSGEVYKPTSKSPVKDFLAESQENSTRKEVKERQEISFEQKMIFNISILAGTLLLLFKFLGRNK